MFYKKYVLFFRSFIGEQRFWFPRFNKLVIYIFIANWIGTVAGFAGHLLVAGTQSKQIDATGGFFGKTPGFAVSDLLIQY
jgi:hypothetical protein